MILMQDLFWLSFGEIIIHWNLKHIKKHIKKMFGCSVHKCSAQCMWNIVTASCFLMNKHLQLLFPFRQLKQLISTGRHVFSGCQRTEAVCVRLGELLGEVCPLEKSKMQTSLRKILGESYTTSKHRFNGHIYQCTIISRSCFAAPCFNIIVQGEY